jgi:uncharacterized sulfatase
MKFNKTHNVKKRTEFLYFFSIQLVLLLSVSFIPKSFAQKRPNILFVISDDQSYLHTSYAGSSFVNTPAFDRIAKEGIYFSNCYVTSPGCAPSRSSIVTGRYPWQNEQAGQHASTWAKKYVPFIDLIEKNGYATGRSGKGVSPFKYDSDGKNPDLRKLDAGGKSYSSNKYDINNDERYANGISATNYFEDFKYFLDEVKKDKPFFFWYGGIEPHRGYEKGSWKKMGKKLEDVVVPKFLPDTKEVREDLLDYAVEIEWFDLHLQKMLDHLESIGELENTIIIVTSDNGMPFPRAKANCYDYGSHVPLAIRYPKEFKSKTTVEMPVSLVDIAPTILEVTNTSPKGMMPITGESMLKFLNKTNSINDEEINEASVFFGRERHSSSRYENLGFPQRAIRKGDYLLIWNMKPELWPAGDPQQYDPNNPDVLMPRYGINREGKYIPQSALMDIDDSPSKAFILENYEKLPMYLKLSGDKRPEFELFNVLFDPDCLVNLSEIKEYVFIKDNLKDTLISKLKQTSDPRVVGPDTEIFDTYMRFYPTRKFPSPH